MFPSSSYLTTCPCNHWPCYCTVHVYVVIHFCLLGFFLVEANLCWVSFFIISLFISIMQLEFQLSKGENLELIDRFYPATLLCLSQARTWISNSICRCPFYMFNELRWEVIDHCLNFLFIIIFSNMITKYLMAFFMGFFLFLFIFFFQVIVILDYCNFRKGSNWFYIPLINKVISIYIIIPLL